MSYPAVETIQQNSICKLVYAPARGIPAAINKNAQEFAKKTVAAFEGKGCYGVEMFLSIEYDLTLCEVACRTHNSGHYTTEGCWMSQHTAHLRAILDLPIPPQDLELRSPAIMLNILGGKTPDSHLKVIERARSIPHASPNDYGKGEARPGRKMGHVTVTARTMAEAEALIQPLIDFADGYRENPVPQKTYSVIEIVMGSDSDLKVLKPGIELLEDYFGIKPNVKITSAHRTPMHMMTNAHDAVERGVKVFIAAAGGAAHLPGMVAGHTPLPVIGLPIKGSTLDGMDSLLSIVQMPRGVPVATVGINNSINAALYAIRILATYDPELQVKLQAYIDENHDAVMEKSERMERDGWRTF